jgi:integrase
VRIEETGGPGRKVWLRDDEIGELRRNAGSQRNDLILLLGGYVGLRANEIATVSPGKIDRSGDGDHYFLRVEGAKDTTGGGGKIRDAYLPEDVELQIRRYADEHNIAPSDQLFDLKTDSVRRVVKRIGERTAEATGNEDFQYVSSHDLRRRFAQRLLVDNRANPRVVMAIGGWDSFEAIEPYLNAPTEDVILDEADRVGLSSL